MFLLNFYRFYVSVAAGAAVYFLLLHSVWIWILTTVLVRAGWFGVETLLQRMRTQQAFTRHIGEFKQLYGPYGIRLANKAENDQRVKNSLAEVFTDNKKQLKKNVEQLEVMDTLFKAGMRPEGDEYLLHDLKLKYGKHRLGG